MIAAQTGSSDDEACAEWVFAPLSISVQISPRTGAFAAFGGWAMPAADYASFHAPYFGPEAPIGSDPDSYAHVEIGGGAHYGARMVWRDFQGGHNFWHFGALCLADGLNIGSYAVLWKSGRGAVATYDACLEWPAMAALDNVLAGAVFGGK